LAKALHGGEHPTAQDWAVLLANRAYGLRTATVIVFFPANSPTHYLALDPGSARANGIAALEMLLAELEDTVEKFLH
jgi:hypothetical protein